MAKVKPRVKVPQTAEVDEVIEIKTLISHPMHSGRAVDGDGNAEAVFALGVGGGQLLLIRPARSVPAIDVRRARTGPCISESPPDRARRCARPDRRATSA